MDPKEQIKADKFTPAYEHIAQSLRRQIATGQLQGGQKLPTERELCARWGVSTITARSAVDQLRSEGLVYSLRGRGTYVRKHERLLRDAPRRWWRPEARESAGLSVATKGRSYDREAKEGNRVPDVTSESIKTRATADIAERLGIKVHDSVMQTAYIISMDGQPVSMSYMWEPLAITGGTDIEHPEKGPVGRQSIVTRFDHIGYPIRELQEDIIIRQPSPPESVRLDIPPGIAVAEIRQVFRAGEPADLIPVATGNVVFATDRYELRYTMEIR